ncbi:MAG: AmmeMemoRadiSam system protein B [Spirochaetales bacterium]|nr:AmmeMemoRadiSam system protein B [Spirochaetales bacterium]
MAEHSGNRMVREATAAGIFYPEAPGALVEALRALFDASADPAPGARAILSPHGGFPWSGKLSALAWKAAKGRRVSTALIIAPLHGADESRIWIPESAEFQTPIGDIATDLPLLREIESCGTVFEESDIPHLLEHGIEVQLPFLHTLFPGAKVAPLLVGSPSPAVFSSLVSALDLIIAERLDELLVVASSDLSSVPRNAEAGRNASLASERALRALFDRDAALLESPGDACGPCGATLLAALVASRIIDGARFETLGTGDSTDANDGKESHAEAEGDSIVSYAACAWYPSRGALP